MTTARPRHDIGLILGKEFGLVSLFGLAWRVGDGLPRLGVFKPAGDELASIIARHQGTPLLVDCRSVTLIANYALENMASQLSASKAGVIFARCNDEVMGAIQSIPAGRRVMIPREKPHTVAFNCVPSVTEEVLERWVQQIDGVAEDHIEKLVRDVAVDFPGGARTMKSTPLTSSGYYDANRLISDPHSLLCISCVIARKLSSILDDSMDNPGTPLSGRTPRLLAMNRKGAVIASIVERLTAQCDGLDVLDRRLTPTPLVEEYFASPFMPDQLGAYIYIGDFMVGGTELKVAEAYAHQHRAQLTHAIVVGSYLAPDQYSTRIRVHPLISLKKLRVAYTFGAAP